MTEYFKVLNDTEFEKLKDAVALIAVYIAGADGKMNDDEMQWAEKITKIRSYSTPDALKGFYSEVGLDFHGKMVGYNFELRGDVEARNKIVEERLAELNPIMAKLNPKLGAALYDSYRTFAKHVAKASGGFLGFFSIGPKEAAVLDLKAIIPIVYVEEE